jgi:hypothetical protein
VDTAHDVGDAAAAAGQAVVDTAHDVGDAAAAAGQAVVDTANDVGNAAVDTAHDIGDAAAAGGQAVVDGVNGVVDGWNNMSERDRDLIHLGLDIIGFVPVVGEVADVANGVLYMMEGDYLNAGISFVSAIPLAGDTAKGGRAVTKGAKFADAAVSISKGAKYADAAVSAHKGFKVASTAWTAADLSYRAFNVGSTGKLSAGAKGLSLASSWSALQGGAGYLSKASAAPKGRLLDLFG